MDPDTGNMQLYCAINDQIKLRFDENEIRLQIARSASAYSVPRIRFPKWSQNTTFQKESGCPLKIKVFFSHRWEDLRNPDPQGEQFRSVVEYLSRIFMLANDWLDMESFAAKELIISESLLMQFRRQRLSDCRCGTVPYLELRSLLGDHDLFYSRVWDIQARECFYQLLKHLHVWYDYTSMPQAPRTPDEQALFEYRLNQLADIASQSEVIILWGAESLNRAWCVLEAMVGQRLHFCAPAEIPTYNLRDQFFQQVIMPRLEEETTGESRLAGYRGRNSPSISIAVQMIKKDIQGKSERAILEYLEQNQITCTYAEDAAIVARLMYRFIGEPSNPSDKPAG